MEQKIYLMCRQAIEKNPEIAKNLKYLLFQYKFNNPTEVLFDSGLKLNVMQPTIGQALGGTSDVSGIIKIIDEFRISYNAPNVDFVEEVLYDKIIELTLACWVDKFITSWNTKVSNKKIIYHLCAVPGGIHQLEFEDGANKLYVVSKLSFGESIKNFSKSWVEFSIKTPDKKYWTKEFCIRDVSVEAIESWLKGLL